MIFQEDFILISMGNSHWRMLKNMCDECKYLKKKKKILLCGAPRRVALCMECDLRGLYVITGLYMKAYFFFVYRNIVEILVYFRTQ